MSLAEFIDLHGPALEQDEVRNNLILGILARAAKEKTPKLLTWTLGGPGACAIKTPGRAIILGNLTRDQCRELADTTRDLDYPGVVGLDLAPQWFVEHAVAFGHAFAEPLQHRILVLRDKPSYSGAPGSARPVLAADRVLFADWLIAFSEEAVPHEPVPPRAEVEQRAGEGRHMFWVVDDQPVSLAGVARQMRNAAAIASVYTPSPLRGRGFAGSVTAAVADGLFTDGKAAVCLFADTKNAASNRCYANIGFKPVANSWVYLRA